MTTCNNDAASSKSFKVCLSPKIGKTFSSSSTLPDLLDVTNNEPLSSSEFQILTPPNSIRDDELCNPTHLRDLQLSLYSASFDLFQDEIHTQLRKNLELKETLHENNIAMSEQFDRLTVWQKELKNAQEQQKSKFEETRVIIQDLHQENCELRQKIEQLEAKKDEEADEFEVVGREFALKEGNQCGNTETERLKIINLQLKQDLKDVSEKLKRVTVSKSHLSREKEDLLVMNQQLRAQLTTSSISTSHQGELQEQMALMVELTEERKMKSILQTELDYYKAKTTTAVLPFSQQETELLQKLKNIEFKLSVVDSHLQSHLQTMQGEIEHLRNIVLQEQAANREDKINLNATHRQFETLLKDYQLFNEQDENKGGVQSTAYYELQMKNLIEQIDRLTAQSLAKEEANVNEMNRLRTQLKAQVYQTDLLREREEKEIALNHVEELKDQCRQLSENRWMRANFQSSPVLIPRSGEASSGKKNPELLCPKCGIGFKELQLLENHVHYCLDNEELIL